MKLAVVSIKNLYFKPEKTLTVLVLMIIIGTNVLLLFGTKNLLILGAGVIVRELDV